MRKLEKYAIKSSVIRKMAAAIYQSDIYNFFKKKLTEFKNYKLSDEIKKQPVPHHVAIIMDGNRRFAKGLNLSPEAGHFLGRDKIKEVLE